MKGEGMERDKLLKNFVVKQLSKTTFFVISLSELHVSSGTIYVINADMAVSMADFAAFFQDEGKVLKEMKTIRNRVTLRAAATRRGS